MRAGDVIEWMGLYATGREGVETGTGRQCVCRGCNTDGWDSIGQEGNEWKFEKKVKSPRDEIRRDMYTFLYLYYFMYNVLHFIFRNYGRKQNL